MRYKLGVVVVENETTRAIMAAFGRACLRTMGEDFEPQVSSGIDGNHSVIPESGHYQARALDMSLYGFSRATGSKVYIPTYKRGIILTETQRFLAEEPAPAKYLAILESSHFHIQRDKQSF